MKWILFMVLMSHPSGSVAVSTAEFESKSACLDATIVLGGDLMRPSNSNPNHFVITSFACVEKGRHE